MFQHSLMTLAGSSEVKLKRKPSEFLKYLAISKAVNQSTQNFRQAIHPCRLTIRMFLSKFLSIVYNNTY